ncbi:MAG: amidohydrolase [Clostridia bacterium]|nr:amidohydrolase [Clostridia bacterium]
MKKLIKNVNIVNADNILKNTNIIINGKYIEKITDVVPEGEFETIDAKGGIAIPGLVNAHTHSPMTLLRNYADGFNLQTWLNDYIFPVEDRLSDDDAYWGSMLAQAEMIASGTTLFHDMYMFMPQVAKATERSGMKALLGRGATYFGNPSFSEHQGTIETIALFKEFNNTADGRIKVNMAPHAVYTTNDKFLRHMKELAQQFGTSLHIHLSETAKENADAAEQYGKSPTKYLYDLGIFDVKVIAAHSVHLSDEDIDILKNAGAVVVHNPSSNLKLGSGIAPLKRLMDAGVDIAIGTDGASSNNNLNMLEELHLASLLTNGADMNPETVSAKDVLKWATNAASLGFCDSGEIAEGKCADIAIIDTNKPHMQPVHNLRSAVCYSAGGGDVMYVFADGKMLFDNGSFTTIDIEKVYFEIGKCVKRIF